jgi:YHS domain-containing protein
MKKFATATAIAIAGMFSPLFAQHDHSARGHATATESAAATEEPTRIGDPWPLDTCVVAGSKLGSMGDPVIKIHEGREVRFCCAGCTGAFESDPGKYLTRADETIIKQQRDFYPLDYCIVDTAEKITDDDAENHLAVIGNRLFVFCCPPCEDTVRAEPAKYIATLDKAVAEKQKADYPLSTCVVSGQPLDAMGGPINVVIANQLVQLCCKGCVSKVEQDPAGILAKVAEARKASESAESTE